jgi:ElaB/YqjD/DUF883 family membrane-anchored ribosome-binding protein
MRSATAFALHNGIRLAKVGCDAIHLKKTIINAAEDNITAAKRALRKSRYAAEDFADEVTFAVKRQPLKSIGITFGVGLGLGWFAGWLGARR